MPTKEVKGTKERRARVHLMDEREENFLNVWNRSCHIFDSFAFDINFVINWWIGKEQKEINYISVSFIRLLYRSNRRQCERKWKENNCRFIEHHRMPCLWNVWIMNCRMNAPGIPTSFLLSLKHSERKMEEKNVLSHSSPCESLIVVWLRAKRFFFIYFISRSIFVVLSTQVIWLKSFPLPHSIHTHSLWIRREKTKAKKILRHRFV